MEQGNLKLVPFVGKESPNINFREGWSKKRMPNLPRNWALQAKVLEESTDNAAKGME